MLIMGSRALKWLLRKCGNRPTYHVVDRKAETLAGQIRSRKHLIALLWQESLHLQVDLITRTGAIIPG